MNVLRWMGSQALIAVMWSVIATTSWAGAPPAQRLPSALLIFPYLEVDGGRDTRIELVNLSGDSQTVNCFYVDGATCNEIGFIVVLTPYQPLAWLASTGLSNTSTGAAAPPFFGQGEMKCVVMPPRPELQFHNTIQGRATVFGLDGATVSYGAVGFRRLTDGDFTGTVNLDGVTYAQCPDRLHFDVLTDRSTSTSDLILVSCSEDLLLQTRPGIGVQFLIINEFEQTFSTSVGVSCFGRLTLGSITDALTRTTAGTDTAHIILRGSSGPLVGLVIDGVPFGATTGTAGNEPSLQGGRSATVVFP